ncbi:MAG TPA: FecR family protein [Chthoniobacterales bacterium]|nr:FecR family protein [Chthoniobacterales bacterium]
MKKMFFPIGVVLAFATVIVLTQFAFAAVKREARVTKVIRDVRLLAGHAAPRPASVNDNVHEGTAVRTGSDSRAELTFPDQTLARLGANTVFSFGADTKTYDLGGGAILMCAPKSSGQLKINTAVATAAVTGFTCLYEYHVKTWNKWAILEGDGGITLTHYPNQTRHLHAGQIIIFRPNATTLPEPQDFDICKLPTKSLLFTQFDKLPTWNFILAECERQRTSPLSNRFVDPINQDALDENSVAHPFPPPPAPRPTFTDGGLRPR